VSIGYKSLHDSCDSTSSYAGDPTNVGNDCEGCGGWLRSMDTDEDEEQADAVYDAAMDGDDTDEVDDTENPTPFASSFFLADIFVELVINIIIILFLAFEAGGVADAVDADPLRYRSTNLTVTNNRGCLNRMLESGSASGWSMRLGALSTKLLAESIEAMSGSDGCEARKTSGG
jgi:hypothetical protein